MKVSIRINKCADYLIAKAPYLDYLIALAEGWPIATGVIRRRVDDSVLFEWT
jgi:hypothetical protein